MRIAKSQTLAILLALFLPMLCHCSSGLDPQVTTTWLGDSLFVHVTDLPLNRYGDPGLSSEVSISVDYNQKPLYGITRWTSVVGGDGFNSLVLYNAADLHTGDSNDGSPTHASFDSYSLADVGIAYQLTDDGTFSMLIPESFGDICLVSEGDKLTINNRDWVFVGAKTRVYQGSAEAVRVQQTTNLLLMFPCLSEADARELIDEHEAEELTQMLAVASNCETLTSMLNGYEITIVKEAGVVRAHIETFLGGAPTGTPVLRYVQVVKAIGNRYEVLAGQWSFLSLQKTEIEGNYTVEFSIHELLNDRQGGAGVYMMIPVLGDWTEEKKERWIQFTIP
jgi:hypothetical protein